MVAGVRGLGDLDRRLRMGAEEAQLPYVERVVSPAVGDRRVAARAEVTGAGELWRQELTRPGLPAVVGRSDPHAAVDVVVRRGDCVLRIVEVVGDRGFVLGQRRRGIRVRLNVFRLAVGFLAGWRAGSAGARLRGCCASADLGADAVRDPAAEVLHVRHPQRCGDLDRCGLRRTGCCRRRRHQYEYRDGAEQRPNMPSVHASSPPGWFEEEPSTARPTREIVCKPPPEA